MIWNTIKKSGFKNEIKSLKIRKIIGILYNFKEKKRKFPSWPNSHSNTKATISLEYVHAGSEGTMFPCTLLKE